MSGALLLGTSGNEALFDVDGSGVLLNTGTYKTRICDLESTFISKFWVAPSLVASSGTWTEIATYALDPAEEDIQVMQASGNQTRQHTIPPAVRREAQLGLTRGWRLGRQTQTSFHTGRLLAAGGQLSYAKLQHLGRFLQTSGLTNKTDRDLYEKTTWSLWGGDPMRRWVTTMLNKGTLALVADGYVVEPHNLSPFDDEDAILFGLTQEGDPFAIEALIFVADDDQPYLWDAGEWTPFQDVNALEDWTDRLVEMDGETAMNVAAAQDENPGEVVHLSTLNPHETALAMMAQFYAEPEHLTLEARVAAGMDDQYTPEERSKNAAEQPRDANGRFATVGAQGSMKSGSRGTIRGVNPMNNYLLVEDENGKVYSIPSRDFTIGNQQVPEPPQPNQLQPGQPLPGMLPGNVPPTSPVPRLDLSKILAQPRALPNSPKAVLSRSLPTMDPAAIRRVLDDYNRFIEEERRRNAGKFATMLSDGIEMGGLGESLDPDSSDVAPIYMAIVDRDDPQAVLDLVALAPGSSASNDPMTFRRVSGKWMQDEKVLHDLRSPTPPPVVMLNEADYQDVVQQVDASIPENRQPQEPSTASAANAEIFIGANNEVWAFWAAGGNNRIGNAERLRQYWTVGKGALKIKWGVPGDFKRCVRHLRKYMPVRTEGYCANLHKRALGVWPGQEGPGRRGNRGHH